jgi:hypothetical protein
MSLIGEGPKKGDWVMDNHFDITGHFSTKYFDDEAFVDVDTVNPINPGQAGCSPGPNGTGAVVTCTPSSGGPTQTGSKFKPQAEGYIGGNKDPDGQTASMYLFGASSIVSFGAGGSVTIGKVGVGYTAATGAQYAYNDHMRWDFKVQRQKKGSSTNPFLPNL